MYIFETEKVRKFFDKLRKKERGFNSETNIYKLEGHDRCEREVFVSRYWRKIKSISMWMYTEHGSRIPVNFYHARFALYYADVIIVNYIDLTRPFEFKQLELDYNKLIHLEGIIVEKFEKDLFKLFIIQEEYKTFRFKAFKIKRKLIETYYDVEAKTINEAFKLKNEYKGDLMIGYEYIILTDEQKLREKSNNKRSAKRRKSS